MPLHTLDMQVLQQPVFFVGQVLSGWQSRSGEYQILTVMAGLNLRSQPQAAAGLIQISFVMPLPKLRVFIPPSAVDPAASLNRRTVINFLSPF